MCANVSVSVRLVENLGAYLCLLQVYKERFSAGYSGRGSDTLDGTLGLTNNTTVNHQPEAVQGLQIPVAKSHFVSLL